MDAWPPYCVRYVHCWPGSNVQHAEYCECDVEGPEVEQQKEKLRCAEQPFWGVKCVGVQMCRSSQSGPLEYERKSGLQGLHESETSSDRNIHAKGKGLPSKDNTHVIMVLTCLD